MLKKIFFIASLLTLVLNSCSSDSGDSDTEEMQSCLPLENLSANVTPDTIFISFASSTTANSFEIEYGIIGFTLGTGNSFVTSDNFIIENLTPNTTYDIYITSICSSENRSEPAELLAVTTSN